MGRIRSLPKMVPTAHGGQQMRPGRLRKNVSTGHYYQINLCGDGRDEYPLVHSLVAAAFLGPRSERLQINHKNGEKLDNRAVNLEYVTPSQNGQHAYRLGLSTPPAGERQGGAKLTDAQARAILLRGRVEPSRALATEFGVSLATVNAIKAGRRWGHLQ